MEKNETSWLTIVVVSVLLILFVIGLYSGMSYGLVLSLSYFNISVSLGQALFLLVYGQIFTVFISTFKGGD